MVLGTVVSAVGAYAFQVVGSRSLGAVDFAPVSVMWTVLFLGFTVFLIPVEQMVIRRLTLASGRAGAVAGSWGVIAAVLAGAAVLAVGFTIVAGDSLLDGHGGFAPVAAVMFLSHGLYVLGRAFLAGRRRFTAYGVAVGLDSLGKVGGAVAVAVAGLGPVALSWALVASPVLVLLVRPFRRPVEAHSVASLPRAGIDRRFMAGFLVATAASQTVLAAGPLVVGALGATSASISVFFVTTTLFRGPMSASYNLVARVLPFMTQRAAAGDHAVLGRLAMRFGAGGLVVAGVVGLGAAALGPGLVALLYGSDFRPSPTLAGLAAAGVVLGIIGLGTTQILVGRGATGRMAIVWLLAVAAAAVAIVVVPGDPTIRVAAGFFTGEAVALLGLTAAAVISPGRGVERGNPLDLDHGPPVGTV
jgi:O-antigen/teichoic acid export membrane protein